MKNYGHNGRLKPEKKKKRKFEAIVNTATQGIYSDFTPMKVAKKVTSELVGKKKQIIFHLREKGKSGKTYGPYIGNIRDGKVVVRTHKMSGGEIGCVFNRITPNNFKVDKKDSDNPPEIEITNFCVTKTTIIFFCTENYRFLNKDGNIYYTYAIYREGDKVFVKNLIFDVKGELIATPLGEGNIGIGKIAEGNIHERKRTLDKIKLAIEAKRVNNKRKDPKKQIAQDIYSAIDTYLQSVQSGITREQPLPQLTDKQKKTAQSLALMHPIFTNPRKNLSVPSSKANTTSALQPQQQRNNQKNFIIQPYICPINNPIEEFKVSTSNEIFFGFDINLLKTLQPPPPKLYYKYSYRDEKFYQLIDESQQPIEMSQIPLYDLLCLYEFARNNNLFKKLCNDISKYKNDYEQKNPRITISFSEDLFSPIKNKNFNKKEERKNTNIGKTKKTIFERKTYYFFGKIQGNNTMYRYACYHKGNDVYYFEIGKTNDQKNLIDLQDRSALEDLKTFIILRRMKNPSDEKFGKEVYEKASERIGQLKFQEIQNKINPNKSPVQTQVQFPFQTPVQSPFQTPVQSPAQSPKIQQPPGKFKNYFRSTLSSPLPSNKKPQLQPQQP
jgi:hypothetical protein